MYPIFHLESYDLFHLIPWLPYHKLQHNNLSTQLHNVLMVPHLSFAK